MRRWHAVLVLIAALLFSSVVQAAPAGLAQEERSGNLGVWQDSRPSDAPLRGNHVVHRPGGGLPDFKKSWIVIIQGTEQAPGVCSYSLGFDEPVETATPKDFLMTAVDPTTCQFEFTVGIPTKVEPPGRAGMEHETSEDGSGSAQASAATALDSYGLGYIEPVMNLIGLRHGKPSCSP